MMQTKTNDQKMRVIKSNKKEPSSYSRSGNQNDYKSQSLASNSAVIGMSRTGVNFTARTSYGQNMMSKT